MLKVLPLVFLFAWVANAGVIGEDNVHEYDPFAVDTACPRVVSARTIEQWKGGIGDQIEHYIYALQCAMETNSSVFLDSASFSVSMHSQSNAHEYADIAQLLGIRVLGPTPPVKQCGFFKVADLEQCDAPDRWCHNIVGPAVMNDVLRTVLRRHGARAECKKRITLNNTKINVVFHIRTGDICLHCDDVDFVHRTLIHLPKNVHIIFESEHDIPKIAEAFPMAEFRHSDVTGAVCLFLLADVLVTTGSSFPVMIAAFAPHAHPVVFEERRKESNGRANIQTHFFPPDRAVLLDNGVVRDAAVVSLLLESASTTVVSGYWKINNKYNSERYKRWISNSVSINSPMVFFYEDENVRRMVQNERGNLPTHFVYRPLTSFALSRLYNTTTWTHPLHVPSKELGHIWLEKVTLVREAADIDMFGTSWFAWIDAGNAEYRHKRVPGTPWPSHSAVQNLPKQKVIYTVSDSNEFHRFAGTAFMYHSSIARAVENAFIQALHECAQAHNDWRCSSDQIVFTRAISAKPELFFGVGSGYGTLVPILFT